jgi:hypothetical protein
MADSGRFGQLPQLSRDLPHHRGLSRALARPDRSNVGTTKCQGGDLMLAQGLADNVEPAGERRVTKDLLGRPLTDPRDGSDH